MKQLNKNLIYNILYQIFIYLVPLITAPYIARVLGADNIGIYSYTYSIAYYFILLSMIGINNYGSRSIAKAEKAKDKDKLSYTFGSIYIIQFVLSIIMILGYIVFTLVFFKEYLTISFIQILFLIATLFDINWFYFGMEKFRITISRNIIIKLISLVLIFLLVKEPGDLWIYTLIMSGSTLLSQIYLWFFIKKYINFARVEKKDIIYNLKQCLILFIPVISYSIYRVMDKTMLGAIAGTTELGYYENAEKIINIPISFITAIGTVMLPYMSKSEDDKKEIFNTKIFYSLELSLLLIVPMMFGLIAVGRDFSVIYYGEEFLRSGTLIVCLAATLLFITIANVIRTNYLIPKGKDKIYVKSTIYAAIINLILNAIFIPIFQGVGACIGTIVAEFSVMLYQCIRVRTEIELKSVIKLCFKYISKGLIMFLLLIIIAKLIENLVMRLIVQVLVAVIFWLIINRKFIINNFLKSTNDK